MWDSREIKEALRLLTSGSSKKLVEDNEVIKSNLSNIETYQSYEVWDRIPGNSTVFSYYGASTPGSDPNNPSGDAGNVATKQYRTGVTVVLTQTFTYTAANVVQSITAS